MRKQSANRKKLASQLVQTKQNRAVALNLLRKDTIQPRTRNRKALTLRQIAGISGASKTIVGEMSKCLQTKDEVTLNRLLNGAMKPGRPSVLTPDEERVIVQRLMYCARRGAALGYDALSYMMAKIAADGRRNGFANGIPSQDTLRAFRARHRELTFRSQESKEKAKLNAENFNHVDRFFRILDDIGERCPGILSNPNRIWNMDETAIDGTWGKKEKVFTASDSHKGGFRACSRSKGANKHVTAVVCVSASGLKTDPFFIVQGKRLNERWFDQVEGSFKNTVARPAADFCSPGWFPADKAVVKVSEHGSMEMGILHAAIEHANNCIRRVVGDEPVILTLDGHASRNGTGWIEACREHNIEAVIAPANTSHILQPCDKDVNKKIKVSVRELRDSFCSQGSVDTRKVNFSLACGVYGLSKVTGADISKSFAATGLFPFERDFARRFRTARDDAHDHRAALTENGSASQGFDTRQTDAQTMERIQEAMENAQGPSTALQTISSILHSAETVNKICMSEGDPRMATSAVSTNARGNVLHDPGAGAECVTLEEVFSKRKEAATLRLAAEVKKKRKKDADAAERVRKRNRKEMAERLGEEVAGTYRELVAGGKSKRRKKSDSVFAASLVWDVVEKALDAFDR